MRTTFESLSAGGGFGVEDGGDSRDRWRRESSQYPSATQLHKGHWCQSRRKTTGQAVQTGGSRRTSRCQTDPPQSGLDGGVMGARPACLLHSIAPAKIGRALGPRGELSPKRARDSCSDRCSTDARQEHSNQRYSRGRGRGRDTGWNNLRLQRQQKCTGRAAASWCSCAPPVCPNLPCALHLAADGPPVNCFLPGGLLRSCSFSNTLAMGPQSTHPAGLQRAFCFQQRPPSAAPRCVPI